MPPAERYKGARKARLVSTPPTVLAEPVARHEVRRNPITGRAEPRIIAPTPFVLRDPSQIPRREWLYGTHLIRREISLTLAPGGVGKTSLGMAEALALASGRKLLHDQPREPLRVWIFNGEEPRDEMERRLAAAAIHYGLSQADIADRLFVDNGNELPIVLADQAREGVVIRQPLIDALVDALKEREVDVLLVDPFVSTHNLAENDNGAIQQAATAWKEVAHRANVAIGLAHHTVKLRDRDATADDGRGASSLVAKARDARVLNPMSAQDAANLGMSGERDSFFWTGPGGKSNMTAKTSRKTWFRLISVGLGNGILSAPEDRVAVVTAWAPPKVDETLCPAAVARLADLLADEQWRQAWQARTNRRWIGHPVAQAFEVSREEGWEEAVRPLIASLERKRVIIRGSGQDERRKSVPIYTLGSREMAEI